MWGMTAWEQAALMIVGWGIVQLMLLLVWARFARREEERRREVMRDDVSGSHVFDDDDFF